MTQADTLITSLNVDLTNCDREQIQYAGAIQPHGAMLVLDEQELRVLQASQNTGELLGIAAEALIGADLQSFLTDAQVEGLRTRLLREKLDGVPKHVGRAVIAGREFDLLAHRFDQVLILELEIGSGMNIAPVLDLYSDLRTAFARLESEAGLQPFLNMAVEQIRTLTGFDRVMVYKFLQDGTGWVCSEAVTEGMEPYLGLHYPAADIPEPARRLFSLTWVRHQPDVSYTPVPMFPQNNPVTGRPLDMSFAFLRSVSIMYVDYLKNMGTRSSMVMTLLKDGQLWGLIACHHHVAPKHVPHETRVACEFLAHTVSLLVSAKEDFESQGYRARLKTAQAAIINEISLRFDPESTASDNTPDLLNFIRADGAAITVNLKISAVGTTPSDAQVERIVTWLSANMREDIFETDCLSAHFPEAEAFKDRAAGLLALRFSKTNEGYLLWFRPEILQTVNWAGNPNKPVLISGDGTLSPRTSFALWQETVRSKSSPWTEVEREAMRELRSSLLDFFLRLTEEGSRKMYADLERSHAELDSFAYIASHDLKEPLRGIHNYAEMLREDYGDKLDDEGQARLATVSRLSHRMDELIDSLLEYSRVGAAKFSIVEVDLNGVLKDALEFLQVLIKQGGVSIRVQPLPIVRGDYIRLVEVFTNLISNAIKYNDKEAKEVEVGVMPAGEFPIFYVRDNGIGIREKHFKQIFEIFRRLHGRNEFGGGTGAGLTILKKIIERHGGRIWLESTVGQGTTFFFTLGQGAGAGEKNEVI